MKRITIEYEALCDDKDVMAISSNVNLLFSKNIRKICPQIKEDVRLTFSCLPNNVKEEEVQWN